MILIDANLLLYARLSSFSQHKRAHQWLDAKLNGITPVGIPWNSLIAFARIAINSRIFSQPLPIAEAWKQVEDWLACQPVWTPTPTDAHAGVLGQIIATTAMTPNLLADAHLAALALEHGLTVCSADRDFSRFQNVQWSNPLSQP